MAHSKRSFRKRAGFRSPVARFRDLSDILIVDTLQEFAELAISVARLPNRVPGVPPLGPRAQNDTIDPSGSIPQLHWTDDSQIGFEGCKLHQDSGLERDQPSFAHNCGRPNAIKRFLRNRRSRILLPVVPVKQHGQPGIE